MPEPMVLIRGLYKIFGPRAAKVLPMVLDGMGKQELLDSHGCVLGLRDINMSVPRHFIQVVMGLSGSGKSTLLRHINRLIAPTAGEIVVDGLDVSTMDDPTLREFRRHRASMVFQRFALLPHRTVRDNIGFGLRIQGLESAEVERRASRWIERVGLEDFADRYPGELSGGMQQRVGLGRALATDPDILLMDEAFSALDPLIRYDMQNMLIDLQKELKKTIVFITHDLEEALRIGDNITILRDGGVVQQGTAQEIVLTPADDYVADFVKDVNRGKVIRVESIMKPATECADTPAIPVGTRLERAALALSEATSDRGTVTGRDGKALGSISQLDLLSAMVRRKQPAN
ncbi:MAG: betaine/proline/choline family ABC transporter ATP-binding protein [Rhodospirillales bacterium]|nr:betaine/proline/choline family ABC transporter ATP-binding protein [Rhodospirillales bacterium]MYE19060.1 betaine/proline/choline family ABC transporter ATP-binding protein [Rhodospirillales bacterium]